MAKYPKTYDTRLAQVMLRLGVNARQISLKTGINHSLITKWQRGERRLSGSNKDLRPLARALAAQDTGGELEALLAPYAYNTGSLGGDLALYLCGEDTVALPARTAPAVRQTTGEYVIQTRVYLGKAGMLEATNDMLDYVLTLPPGREIICVTHGNFDWVTGNLPYTLLLISRMKKAFERGTTLTMVIRRGFSPSSVSMFAGPWLVAHMRGYIRSLYYDGPQPPGDRMVAAIEGYWSLSMREDPEVEDGLFITMHTDAMSIRQDTRVCEEWRARAQALFSYDALRRHSLPAPPAPAGKSLVAVQALPGAGLFTRAEFETATGDWALQMPESLVWEGSAAQLPSKIILNKDALRIALTKQRVRHPMLSVVCGRRVYITRPALVALLWRLVKALQTRPDFELALVPERAFAKIELEMLSWEDAASLCWLTDTFQSSYTTDETMRASLHAYGEYAWDRLQAGWKRKRSVLPILRRWLRGEGLRESEPESARLQNWHMLPKD